MADDSSRMSPREPGDKGSTQGQIQTPMCSDNVGNKGDPGTQKYTNIVGGANGKGGEDIMGPGAKGMWDTQITIKGSNKKY